MASPLHYLEDPETLERERRAFLDAAMHLLGQSGTVDLQVVQVVRQAGRHNAAFYRIFGSKEGLVLAVVEESVRRAVLALERAMRTTRTPEDAVRAWVRVLLGLASAGTAAGVQAIALDRYRLLRRFPAAEASIADPLRAPLERVLAEAGLPDAALLTEAAFELVLSRQASWLALRQEPTPRQIRWYSDLTVRMVGLPST